MNDLDSSADFHQDIRLLGELLGKTLRQQVGEELYEKIENIRRLAKAVFDGQPEHIPQLNELLAQLAPNDMLGVVRSFSHFLNLANIADNVHRIRRIKWYRQHLQSAIQPGSLKAIFLNLQKHQISQEAIQSAIADLKIDLVLTAHPTEVMRRTIIQKFDRIAHYMEQTEDKANAVDGIYREITAIWQTDEIRSRRPTPLDEAKWGFAVIESSLWHALPEFLREFDQALLKWANQRLPLTAAPIRFSSWIGGDRDGNPNVTAKITEQVCLMARWVAADLYEQNINDLSAALSMEQCDETLQALVGNEQEPYRAFLRPLKRQLALTKRFLEDSLANRPTSSEDIILDKQTLLEPLLICYQSLIACRARPIAEGELTDLIRRVSAFGICLLPLDIRQEAAKHTLLLDELTQSLGLGSYAAWPESQRMAFLQTTLEQSKLLFTPNVSLSDEASIVWDTFKMIARQLPDSLGAYVISMVHEPSDVLAVCLLQREAGIANPLRVVPLFETQTALINASSCLEALLNNAWYKAFIAGYQEVMIGYSDSGKDAGILAAGWAQYQAQEQLIATAKQHQIKLTLFHGRGGSIGRGGAPAHEAILSLPPGAVMGGLRVTEQGEVIRNKYGLQKRARRTLEIYTTATLEAMLLPQAEPEPSWREMMKLMSETSFQEYCRIVKEDQDFMPYFEAVTPLREIGSLMIGSRPARRQQHTHDIGNLRAIPWVFAWTQNRLLLPAWLGVDAALMAIIQQGKTDLLQEMVEKWPFFRTLLNMIEMVLVKADLTIATLYENRLAPDQQATATHLHEKFSETVKLLKTALSSETLLSTNSTLLRTINLRSPYLYPLHALQAELLWRVRTQSLPLAEAEILQHALMVSISGIAAGMQNTG
ncbi:phosphoenolpyruvate carboxylase [Candidatus Berkiella aquae]|uniref:Phosphoenolpyruvate carboxylase n=1 Tax=Candidatus Berkiella aquae TaxID=295108 RepID=A0A0Q9YKP2_9GAMM|nr:phosphoenolpyruvate carboxylase [Candidatus Berkiella aquae]MCS5711105.1 phosphoenolpyruvate carboxylase [Candidatus Berkiella aquae]